MLEIFYNSKGELNLFFVKKHPLYEEHGNIIGASGIAINSTKCPIINTAYLMLANDNDILLQNSNNINQVSYQLLPKYENHYLTESQSQTLFFIIRGKPNKWIANRLGIKEKTVDHYVEQLRSKFKCNRYQIIEKAIENGMATTLITSLLNSDPKCRRKRKKHVWSNNKHETKIKNVA